MNITIIVISSYLVGVLSCFGWNMLIGCIQQKKQQKQQKQNEEEKDE